MNTAARTSTSICETPTTAATTERQTIASFSLSAMTLALEMPLRDFRAVVTQLDSRGSANVF
ncbi:MAG TPA: hypothetical protein VIJ38_03420 [Acidobacteriaceae bacterium]